MTATSKNLPGNSAEGSGTKVDGAENPPEKTSAARSAADATGNLDSSTFC